MNEMNKNEVLCPPNPRKLYSSLRNMSYTCCSAIMDIVDNSFDAFASEVRIEVNGEKPKSGGKGNYREKITSISISDNGIGMDRETLEEAIKLGSETEHRDSDLGLYGAGLKTGAISIGRRLTIETLSEDGPKITCVLDLDEISRKNEWIVTIFDSEPRDSDKLGTKVTIDKIDREEYKTTDALIKDLTSKRKLAQVYRYYINAGKKIFVNGTLIDAYDPLEWGAEDTDEEHKYEDEVVITDGGKEIGTLKFRLSVLGKADERSAERAQDLQGFSVVRNNREIISGTTLGIYTKNHTANRLRGEVVFQSGAMDEHLSLNINKTNIRFSQSVIDQVKAQGISANITAIRNFCNKRSDMKDGVKKSHERASKIVEGKAGLLNGLPKADKETRSPKSDGGSRKPPIKRKGGERVPKKVKSNGLADKLKIEHTSMSDCGPVFDYDKQGQFVVLRLNSDHPFIKKVYGDNLKDDTATVGLDHLLYSWAIMELRYGTENQNDMQDVLRNARAEMSGNLRTLCS